MLLPPQLPTEQIAQRTRVRRLLTELNIYTVVAPDSWKQDVIPMMNLRSTAFANDEYDNWHRILSESRIETGSSLPIKD